MNNNDAFMKLNIKMTSQQWKVKVWIGKYFLQFLAGSTGDVCLWVTSENQVSGHGYWSSERDMKWHSTSTAKKTSFTKMWNKPRKFHMIYLLGELQGKF